MEVLFKCSLINPPRWNCSRLPVLMSMSVKKVPCVLCSGQSSFTHGSVPSFLTPDSNTIKLMVGFLLKVYKHASWEQITALLCRNNCSLQRIAASCGRADPWACFHSWYMLADICGSCLVGLVLPFGTSHNKRQFLKRESDCLRAWKKPLKHKSGGNLLNFTSPSPGKRGVMEVFKNNEWLTGDHGIITHLQVSEEKYVFCYENVGNL